MGNKHLSIDTKTSKVADAPAVNFVDVLVTLGSVIVDSSEGVKTIALGDVSGVRFGNAGDKVGFLGAVPVVRPVATADIRQALINLGLYTAGGASPLNLNGGTITAGLVSALSAAIAQNVTIGGTLDITGGLTAAVTAPTAPNENSSTRIATTAFVHALITDLIGGSPATLNAINELAAAIGNDPNFATTVAASVASKLTKAANLSDLTDMAQARANLGLGNVNDTPDLDKPVSGPQAAADALVASFAADALAAHASAQAIALAAINNAITDLGTEVDALTATVGTKANDSAVVHKTGAETIAGPKNFTSQVTVYALAGNSLTATLLATPAAPTVTAIGNNEGVTRGYKITALLSDGAETDASPVGATTQSDETLDGTNRVSLAWAAIAAATSYNVYRLANDGVSPATVGKIANVITNAYVDTGAAGDGSTPPTINATGRITGDGSGISAVVHTSGDEEIADIKKFTDGMLGPVNRVEVVRDDTGDDAAALLAAFSRAIASGSRAVEISKRYTIRTPVTIPPDMSGGTIRGNSQQCGIVAANDFPTSEPLIKGPGIAGMSFRDLTFDCSNRANCALNLGRAESSILHILNSLSIYNIPTNGVGVNLDGCEDSIMEGVRIFKQAGATNVKAVSWHVPFGNIWMAHCVTFDSLHLEYQTASIVDCTNGAVVVDGHSAGALYYRGYCYVAEGATKANFWASGSGVFGTIMIDAGSWFSNRDIDNAVAFQGKFQNKVTFMGGIDGGNLNYSLLSAATIAHPGSVPTFQIDSDSFYNGAIIGTPGAGVLVRGDGVPWTPYTVNAIPAGGAFGSLGTVTGHYNKTGRTIDISIVLPIISNGTGSGYVRVSLPFIAAARRFTIPGRESTAVGFSCMGDIGVSGSEIAVFKFDGSYPGGNNYTISLTGRYETV